VLDKVDLVLVMGVEPGFGGQDFNPEVISKIRTLREIRDERKLNLLIEVDGGVNDDTIADISEAGCDVFVTGSYFFRHKKGMKYALERLKDQL
jgi:ribulose-phosphate 3-epimerase